MKRLSMPFWAILLFIPLFLTSCDQKEKEFEQGLLWRISGNGLEKPSYILGINNLVDVNFLGGIVGFEQAFNNTEEFIGEVAISPDDSAQAQDTIRKAGQIALGDGYRKRLSESNYKKLDEGLINVFGDSLSNAENLYPSLILSSLSKFVYVMANPTFNPMCHESMDSYLQKMAKAKDMQIVGLETLDDQMTLLFKSNSFEKQIEILICFLDNLESNKQMMSELDSFYKEQSLSKIYDLYSQKKDSSCPSVFEMQFALDRKRNSAWLTKLPDIMKQKSSFVAVGALHLAGEDGLLSELNKMGYTVETVH